MPLPSLVIPGVHSRIGEKEFNIFLRAFGVLPNYDWSYSKDHHWQWYNFHDINSVEDALRFADENDAHCRALGGMTKDWGCAKNYQIREWLAKPFWRESVSRIRVVLSCSRRTCCACHETCSYKPRVRV